MVISWDFKLVSGTLSKPVFICELRLQPTDRASQRAATTGTSGWSVTVPIDHLAHRRYVLLDRKRCSLSTAMAFTKRIPASSRLPRVNAIVSGSAPKRQRDVGAGAGNGRPLCRCSATVAHRTDARAIPLVVFPCHVCEDSAPGRARAVAYRFLVVQTRSCRRCHKPNCPSTNDVTTRLGAVT